MKGPRSAQVAPAPVKQEAGGDAEDHSDAESEEPIAVVYPENIHKRLNALKNIHLESQKLEQELHVKLFLAEAEMHKRMAPLLAKRAEIVSGKREPDESESTFKLKEDEPKAETIPADNQVGIPNFWLGVLRKNMEAASFIQSHDEEVLAHLTDIRVVYQEKPLGFKVEFEFSENPFFGDQVLSRTYEYNENVPREDLYLNSGLSPKMTSGSGVSWKEGKNLTRKTVVTVQRNKKTKQKREIKSEADQDTLFKFFIPEVTDLSTLAKLAESLEDEEESEEQEKVAMKIHQAETEYEFACTLRAHVIPRALLLFTGEDSEDEDYSDEEDDEDEEDADESEEEEPSKKGKGGNKAIKKGEAEPKGAGKAGKHGGGCCDSGRPHKHHNVPSAD